PPRDPRRPAPVGDRHRAAAMTRAGRTAPLAVDIPSIPGQPFGTLVGASPMPTARRQALRARGYRLIDRDLLRLELFHVAMPLKRTIRHASHARTTSDSLVVRATVRGGHVGYGEGVPRPYVTGETIATTFAALA